MKRSEPQHRSVKFPDFRAVIKDFKDLMPTPTPALEFEVDFL
jgi:hypothetical protein